MNSAGLSLASGPLRCALRPDLGGCIAGLWWHGRPVLRSTEAAALASVRLSACYPLLPFSNRVGLAQFHWLGRRYALQPNFAPEPHAIHGVGWQRAWTCVAADGHSAELAYAHASDAAWPFAFDAVQHITLTDQGLRLQLSLTNRAPHPVPAGLGWHPYVAKRAGSHLRFQATQRWAMGADKLPTQAWPSTGLDRACADLTIDHCFDGWAGMALVEDEHLSLRLRSDLGRLVVFTDPARDFVAVEPVSHVNNAWQLAEQLGQDITDLGLAVLQPGQSLSAFLVLEVAARPQLSPSPSLSPSLSPSASTS